MEKLKQQLPIISSIITILIFIYNVINSIEIKGIEFNLPQLQINSIIIKILLIMLIEFVIAISYSFLIYTLFKKNVGTGILGLVFFTILITWIRILNYKAMFFPDIIFANLDETDATYITFYKTLLFGTLFFSFLNTPYIVKYNDDISKGDFFYFKPGCSDFLLAGFFAGFLHFIFVSIILMLLITNYEI